LINFVEQLKLLKNKNEGKTQIKNNTFYRHLIRKKLIFLYKRKSIHSKQIKNNKHIQFDRTQIDISMHFRIQSLILNIK